MTTDFIRPEHPEDEDSWSDLAGDLFGIDFAQTPESGEFVSPEELLAEDDQTPPDSKESKGPTLAVGSDETVEAEESPLSAIETEATEQETSPSIQDLPEVEGSEDEQPTSERDRSKDQTEKDDNFWDPLNEWNWDEGKVQAGNTNQDSSHPERSRSKRSSFERQKPVSSRIVREEDGFSSVEDLHDEYIDDSGFGAGLLQEEDEPVSESEITDSAEEKTEPAEEARSKSQRSRRRRRPRRAKKETGDGVTVSDGDNTIELNEESSDGDKSSDQDDAAEATPRKRPSRRRSSRSRRKQSDSPTSEQDSQTPEPTAESEEFGESILDEELDPESEESSRESQDLSSKSEGQSKTSHRDVPTWEEAISYLLSPSKPTAGASSALKTSPASTATKESSESSKPPARRRRRRR